MILFAAVAPPSFSNDPDIVAWTGSHDGNFSIKSSYYCIAGFDNVSPDPLFWLIWRWKGMERIKLFLWQVACDALPTNYFRFSRHITDAPLCTCCDLQVYETSLHVLRDCPIALNFWSRLVSAVERPSFYTLLTRAGLMLNLKDGESALVKIGLMILLLLFIIYGRL